ncbi:MAG: ABC transporter permease, partial [Eubacterium sp.]
PKQFEEISVYDGMMAFKNEGTPEEKAPFESELKADSNVTTAMMAKQLKMSVEAEGGDQPKNAYLFVPEIPQDINQFVTLRHRQTPDQKLTLGDEGAIISEKLARDLDIKVGDTIRLYSDDTEFKLKVTDVTENYLQNYVYVSPKAYEAATGQTAKYNIVYFNLKDTGTEAEEAFGVKWLDNPEIVSVSFTGSIVKSSSDSLSSLNMVVIVMLVAAGALAFVVLYNLTNINVSERVREIATIRVLGFYDREVNNYIFLHRHGRWTGIRGGPKKLYHHHCRN